VFEIGEKATDENVAKQCNNVADKIEEKLDQISAKSMIKKQGPEYQQTQQLMKKNNYIISSDCNNL
jgi:hypothetical protein